jgi:V/A-type H+-transporting ATPase subunit C
VILKGIFLNEDLSHLIISVGSLDPSKLKKIIENKELSDFPEVIRKGINDATIIFENTKDPQMIDIILDKYMFKSLIHIKDEMKDTFIDKYVATLIDSTNLKTLLRVKKQNKDREFLESVIIEGGFLNKDKILSMLNDEAENMYGKISTSSYSEFIKNGLEYYSKTGSVSLLEKLFDNYIMQMMKAAKIIPFGVEPLLAYIYAKETEIKIIRIIMVGKINNISGELVRERLRDIYV